MNTRAGESSNSGGASLLRILCEEWGPTLSVGASVPVVLANF
jgi:hypothetical protein